VFNRFLSLGALDNAPEEKFADLTHSDHTRWKSRLQSKKESPQWVVDLFRSLTKEGKYNLEEAPPSNFLGNSYVAVTNGLAKRYAQESMRVALRLISEYWLDYALHPCEYQDIDDFITQALLTVIDDYEHAALPAVQLFGGPEDFVDSEDQVVKKDVIKYWDSYTPEGVGSKCGGQLFLPRPQGFEILEEFLRTFGQDDNCINDNCPTDDQGFDGSQGL
jgi:hypothetical protein